ncbi:MAG: DUF2339 domain-containing protein [Campylobacterota bacterium]
MQTLVLGIILFIILTQIFDNIIINLLLSVLSVSLLALNQQLNTLKSELAKKERTRRRGRVTPVTAPIQPARVQQPREEPSSVHKQQVKPMSATQTSKLSVRKTVPREQLPIDVLDPLKWFKTYLAGGNPIVRVGVIILFFGMAFLAKYAIEQGFISIEMRLGFIALLGVGLTTIGWRLRNTKGEFGLILQGGGVAMIYLVIFASAKLYELFPLVTAFGMMLAVVMGASFLAVRQDALPLALFATVGGFAVPILTSDGGGSHILLFSYYALLNIGIVFIAWFKSWRLLNLSGFVLTFVVATLWGTLEYKPEFLTSTEPFLILFFIFYLSVSVLFAFKQPFQLKGYVDTTLVFGLPLIGFAWQRALFTDNDMAMAISAAVLSLLYVTLYKALHTKEQMQLLAHSFLALSVLFFTLIIPYALDGFAVSVLWSVEGAAILWVGLKQGRPHTRSAALGIQAIALVQYLTQLPLESVPYPFLNIVYFSSTLIVLPIMFSAWLYEHFNENVGSHEKGISIVLLSIGTLFWLFIGYQESLRVEDGHFMPFLLYVTLTGFTFLVLTQRLSFKSAQTVLPFSMPLGLTLIAAYAIDGSTYYLTSSYAAIVLALFFTLYYTLLKKHSLHTELLKGAHVLGAFSIMSIFSHDLIHVADTYFLQPVYPFIFAAITPALLFLLLQAASKKSYWPLAEFKAFYHRYIGGMFTLLLAIWWLLAISFDGVTTSAYTPIINPLDLFQLIVIAIIWIWHQRNKAPKERAYILMGSMLFIQITTVLARSFSAFDSTPYRLESLLHNISYQMTLSIMWTVIALALILYAKRVQVRTLWVAGAVLLAAVVLKLFVIELGNSGTIERIISFSVVGILIVLIGFFAPLPPKKLQNVR